MRKTRMALLLGATLALGAVGPAEANTPLTVRKYTVSAQECKAAQYVKHSTAACVTTVTYGAVTVRTARVTVPKRPHITGTARLARSALTTACAPVIDPGCAGPPNPAKWYFVDSFIDTVGPIQLWQVTTYYHVKTNGYQVLATAPFTCETFAAGITITPSFCGMSTVTVNGKTAYLIGARWKECFVHPILGFCRTKGSTMTIDPYGNTLARSSW